MADAMNHPVKITHFTDKGYNLKGIIHGGANDGEEVAGYKELGIANITCFEPLSSAYEILTASYPDIHSYRIALGNTDGTETLQVTYGDGKGSSILNPNLDHPEVKANWNLGQATVIGSEEVFITRFDTWAKKHPEIKLSDYDCLVLDTQGNELEVLQGMGKLLANFKYLNIELSEVPIYEGEASAQEVIDWLAEKGFAQDSPIEPHNDVMFIRKDLL